MSIYVSYLNAYTHQMLSISLLSALALSVSAYDLSYFPAGYSVPPVNPAMTAALLAGFPIPNLPPRGAGEGIDWSRMSHQCTDF
jgi:hypothetical protein